MAKKKIFGNCRVCGDYSRLTEEHYIPRAAGGGQKIQLYSGEELIKVFQKDNYGEYLKPYGQIRQAGLSEYTLCKRCNDEAGHNYDKNFADFHNRIHYGIIQNINIPDGLSANEYLEGKGMEITLSDIFPLNIAKRILLSFCSVEHEGLTDRVPEIRKAIMEKDYRPNTKDFAIYMSLHVGNSAYYGTVAALKSSNGKFYTQAYAGIENELLAFYFTNDPETISRGMDNCVDITYWLTNFSYNQSESFVVNLMFQQSLMVRFPITPAEQEKLRNK